MKISVDGLLGSARKINSQRQSDEKAPGKKSAEIKSDSVSIGSRVNTRIDRIENELRDIQSSLTMNQIRRDSLLQLQDDIASDGKNSQTIIDEARFNGQPLLQDLSIKDLDPAKIETKSAGVNELLSEDVNRLKRLQIEVDNIMASNLAGNDRVESLIEKMEENFPQLEGNDLTGITNLNADTVMKLIR